jgi:4-hydroxy-tetrahydrodipicolinate synthase
MTVNFHGALAEIFLALDADGQPDNENTAKHVRYLLENKVQGLFVGGVAAEGFTFNTEERMKWLKIAVDETNDKTPVIFNISSININEIALLAKRAVDIGADVISFTQPAPVLFSEAEILEYYGKIANTIDVPIMLYNESAIGNPLKIDLVKKIFLSLDNFLYYKDSTHNLIDLHSLLSIDRSPKVFAGSDGLIYDIMASGGSGVVSLIIDVFPKLITEIVDYIERGDFRKALTQQRLILRVRSVLKTGGLTAGYRYASSLVGVDLGKARLPYSSISENDKFVIKNGLATLGLI